MSTWLEIQYNNVPETEINFPNMDYVINQDVYINTDSTYRQVLDDISNIAGSSMRIKDNKLYLHQFNETGLTLSQNLAKSMEIGEKIGKFNVLNLAREPQNDNYPYPLDFDTIPEKDRVEFVIANNPIIDNDRETLAPLIFPLINNFDYYIFNHNAQGYGIFNVGDIVTLEDLKGNEYKSIVTDETSTFKQMNLSETESKVLSNLKPEYAKPNQLQKFGREMYFIVDQQNGIIEGLINEVDEVKDETARLTIEVDKIETTVENVHLGNIIPNANGELQYVGWSGTGELLATSDLIAYDDLTVQMTAIPKEIPNSASRFGWEFFTSGQMISDYGYVLGGNEYSFKAKIGNFKPCIITVYEYKADKSANGTIVKQFNNPQSYIQFTDNLKSDTVYVELGIEFPSATPSSRPNISEIMYNKGLPKEWFASADEVMSVTRTLREQTAQGFRDQVIVNGELKVDIEANKDGLRFKADKIELQGLVSFTDLSSQGQTTINGSNITTGTISADRINFDGATGNNVNLSGDITATSGKIGEFDIRNGSIEGEKLKLTKNRLDLGDDYIEGSVIQEGTAYAVLGTNRLWVGKGSGTWISLPGSPLVRHGNNGATLAVYANNLFPNGKTLSSNNIGQDNNRYNNLYLSSQPDVSSDTRIKQNILPIDKDFIQIFGDNVEPRTYIQNDKIHFGYVAQDIERALFKYATSRKNIKSIQEAKEYVKEFAVLNKSESYQSLLYGEIAVIMDAYARMSKQSQQPKYSRPRTSSFT